MEIFDNIDPTLRASTERLKHIRDKLQKEGRSVENLMSYSSFNLFITGKVETVSDKHEKQLNDYITLMNAANDSATRALQNARWKENRNPALVCRSNPFSLNNRCFYIFGVLGRYCAGAILHCSYSSFPCRS